jgi:hypothetical protein
MDTRLETDEMGETGLAMPSPLVVCRFRPSAMSSSSSSSNTVDGVLRSVMFASLCTRWYPGREYVGLADGEACVMGLKPNVWELEEKPSDGSAGVLFALSERSEDS